MFSLCPLATQTLVPNPLSATHNFMQACSICFAREGGWVGTMPICPTLHCSLVYNVFTATNVSKSCQRHCTILFYFLFFQVQRHTPSFTNLTWTTAVSEIFSCADGKKFFPPSGPKCDTRRHGHPSRGLLSFANVIMINPQWYILSRSLITSYRKQTTTFEFYSLWQADWPDKLIFFFFKAHLCELRWLLEGNAHL